MGRRGTSFSLKLLFIVLFASYYVAGTAFTHTHHYLTYSITHSHPFLPGEDGLPHHQHDLVTLFTIEQLNNFETEALSFLPLEQVWILLSVFLFSFHPRSGVRLRRRSCLRAPPCSL